MASNRMKSDERKQGLIQDLEAAKMKADRIINEQLTSGNDVDRLQAQADALLDDKNAFKKVKRESSENTRQGCFSSMIACLFGNCCKSKQDADKKPLLANNASPRRG